MSGRVLGTKIRRLLALTVAGAAVLASGEARTQASQPKPDKAHPLWEMDLHRFGYEQVRQSNSYRPRFYALDFTANDRLAWAWLTYDGPPTAAQKKYAGFPQPEPAHLHVLILDARTGRKLALHAWPTQSLPVCFFGIGGGKFLTCAGGKLGLFSPSLAVLREQDLPTPDSLTSLHIGISPTRQTLLISYSQRGLDRVELVDTNTLAVTASWTEGGSLTFYGVADRWLVETWGVPPQPCIRPIGGACKPHRPLGLDTEMLGPMRLVTNVANDNTLVLEAGRKMVITTPEGTPLLDVSLPKNRSFGELVASSRGDRFAVMENRRRGLTIEALDMYAFGSNDRVVVYSIPCLRAIYTVKVKGTSPWTPWVIHENRTALSPDGTLLAIESDSALKVYALPPANTFRH